MAMAGAISVGRVAAVLTVLACGFTAMAARVAYLQTYGREETVRRADRQQHRQQVLPARRGSVFDRNGLLMAGTAQSRVLFADPQFMTEQFAVRAQQERDRLARRAELIARGKAVSDPTPEQQARAAEVFPGRYRPWDVGIDTAIDAALTEVAQLLHVAPAEIIRQVRLKPDARFVRLVERVDDAAAARITALRIPGLGFSPMPVRTYPMGELAAHILGGLSSDGSGIDGLEQRYESILRGRDGFLRQLSDSRGRPIAATADDFVAPTHGRHLVLSIDMNIQMIAEQELRASIAEFNAKSGEVIVMDPWTGEILALANWPTYDPAAYLDVDADARRNRALVAPYEPGSTIKPFIVGPALEDGVIRMADIFNLHGGKYRTPYGRLIQDVAPYDRLNVWDILVKSSNVGMSLITQRMSNNQLHDALTGFGFGRPSGIELPGETRGRLNPVRQWSRLTPDSLAMGYEVMVTPLQLAAATCVLANGGVLVRPTILKGIVDDNGAIEPVSNRGGQGTRALEPQTAADIRNALADVLARGTGTRARSDTYNLFGKTGTAHLVDPATRRYSNDRYTSSFVGGAPLEHPRLVVAFVIHEAEKKGRQYFGGTTAAPGAALVLERSLRYLGVEPSPPLQPPPPHLMAGLHNFRTTPYINWPENVRRERTAAGRPLNAGVLEGRSAWDVMLSATTRPGIWSDLPELEDTIPLPDDEVPARPASGE